MEGLGRLFDIVAGVVPVDLSTAAVTGKRVSLKNAGGCTVVLFKAAGTADQDPALDLKQHTAATGGTSADLDIVDHYFVKSATALAGSETWTRVTQTAASEVTDPGGLGTSAESQQIVVFEVDAAELTDGYGWISLDIADVGANAQLGSVLYILRDLHVQRTPQNLANPQAA